MAAPLDRGARHMPFTSWDLLLIAAVSLQTLVLAYVYPPRWKALIWNLPIPFTMASLSLQRPIDATNVCGLLVLFVYAHGVRLLHVRFRVAIVLSIGASALTYVALGRGWRGCYHARSGLFGGWSALRWCWRRRCTPSHPTALSRGTAAPCPWG